MKKRLPLIIVTIVLSAPAFAQIAGTPNSNAVFVGGTPIIRVRVAADGYTPVQRARQIQLRVNKLLGMGPIMPSDIQVDPLGNEAVVRVKGHLLFTVDWATAHFDQTTPLALANEWADHMRQVLPSLTKPKG